MVYYLPVVPHILGDHGNSIMESVMIDEDPPGFSHSARVLIFTSAAIVWICIIAGIIYLIAR